MIMITDSMVFFLPLPLQTIESIMKNSFWLLQRQRGSHLQLASVDWLGGLAGCVNAHMVDSWSQAPCFRILKSLIFRGQKRTRFFFLSFISVEIVLDIWRNALYVTCSMFFFHITCVNITFHMSHIYRRESCQICHLHEP